MRSSIAEKSPSPTVSTDTRSDLLVIEEQVIPTEYRRVPLDQVFLDPDNPRIQHAVRQKWNTGEIKQEDLQQLIWDRQSVSELFKSIRDNGGLIDPVHLRPNGKIIEGNCRTVCYLRLRKTFKDDPRWQSIPAIIIPQISDRQVAILQGKHHVAGKTPWEAYEKAGHLHFMSTKLGMDEKAIAKTLGLTEGEVTRTLQSYRIMNENLLPKLKGVDAGNVLQKWSFVEEFCKRKELKEYRSKPSNVDEFVSLIANGKLKRGVDVRSLGSIVQNSGALTSLKKHGIESAVKVARKSDPTVDSSLLKKVKQLTSLLKELPSPELDEIRENEKSQELLQELFAALKGAARAARVKLT